MNTATILCVVIIIVGMCYIAILLASETVIYFPPKKIQLKLGGNMTAATVLCIALIIVIICGISYIACLLDERNRAYAYVEKHTGLSMEMIIRAGRGEIK